MDLETYNPKAKPETRNPNPEPYLPEPYTYSPRVPALNRQTLDRTLAPEASTFTLDFCRQTSKPQTSRRLLR